MADGLNAQDEGARGGHGGGWEALRHIWDNVENWCRLGSVEELVGQCPKLASNWDLSTIVLVHVT